jgi:hypothetical protein|tara:strand:- start:2984 stop:3445 length:462 start_codon:yes stop_codon:yes gene_type:complete
MISLLGSLLGFGTSFMPSVLGFFEKKAKFKQDLLMLEAKAKYAEQMSKYKIKELDAQADIEESKSIYQHDQQLSKSNKSRFISSLQASVRPVITYLLFGLFAFVKITEVVISVQNGDNPLRGVVNAWDVETQGLFSCVIAFWFGNRAMKRMGK